VQLGLRWALLGQVFDAVLDQLMMSSVWLVEKAGCYLYFVFEEQNLRNQLVFVMLMADAY
jgi:hypothetical protein